MDRWQEMQACRPGPERPEGWHFFGVFPWSKGRTNRDGWFAKVMRVLLFPATAVVVGVEIAHLVAGWAPPLAAIVPAAVVVVAYLVWIARESIVETRLLVAYHRDAASGRGHSS